MIVKCPKCGTQNTIPDTPEPSRRYLCAKCKAGLTDVPPIPETKKQRVPRPQIAIQKDEKKTTVLGKVLRKLSWVHPLLFALFPALYLYSQNVAEVTPSQLVVPLIASLGFAVLVFVFVLLVIALIKRQRLRLSPTHLSGIWDSNRAGIIASVFLILFFNYGDALDLITRGQAPELTRGPQLVLALLWILLVFTIALLVIRTRRSLANLTAFMVIAGAVLVIVPSANIVSHEIRFGGYNVQSSATAGNATAVGAEGTILPDIYYIIPDRYGSESGLEQDFQFDNSEFIDYLTNKGFYIAESSHSNYSRTFASLASSLNMEYINYLTNQLGEDFQANYPMWQLIQDNKVCLFLKSKGYKFVNLGDQWDGTSWNRNADINYNLWLEPQFSLSEFSSLLFKKTLAYPFAAILGIATDEREMYRENTLYLFNKLAEIPSIQSPTFAFAHLRLPHDPYVFDANGDYKTPQEEQHNSYRDNYVDQLVFANSKLESLVDKLLTESEVPPIIIIQGDEGPFPVSEPWLGEKATQAGLEIKMGILNAYYLPGVDTNLLYSSITPVNSFRLVFDQYFGTNFGLLDDKCYAYDEGYPERFVYKFIDVTDKLKQN